MSNVLACAGECQCNCMPHMQSLGEGASLGLVGHPFSDGVTIILNRVDV